MMQIVCPDVATFVALWMVNNGKSFVPELELFPVSPFTYKTLVEVTQLSELLPFPVEPISSGACIRCLVA